VSLCSTCFVVVLRVVVFSELFDATWLLDASFVFRVSDDLLFG
jgi:hypothetical protein